MICIRQLYVFLGGAYFWMGIWLGPVDDHFNKFAVDRKHFVPWSVMHLAYSGVDSLLLVAIWMYRVFLLDFWLSESYTVSVLFCFEVMPEYLIIVICWYIKQHRCVFAPQANRPNEPIRPTPTIGLRLAPWPRKQNPTLRSTAQVAQCGSPSCYCRW